MKRGFLIFAAVMKKTIFLYTSIAAVGFAACKSKLAGEGKKQLPKPGTTVAEAKMPITDDALNHFTFSVKVVADSDIANGVYDIDADYGPNFAEGKLTMPKGAEDAKLDIRKGNTPYTFIVGFRMPGDTTFNEYFQVTSTKNNTRMEYTKAYTF